MVLLTSILWLQSTSSAISVEVDRPEGLGANRLRHCFISWWPKGCVPPGLSPTLAGLRSGRQEVLFRAGKLLDLKVSSSHFCWTAPTVAGALSCSPTSGCGPLLLSMALRIQIRSLIAFEDSGAFHPPTRGAEARPMQSCPPRTRAGGYRAAQQDILTNREAPRTF